MAEEPASGEVDELLSLVGDRPGATARLMSLVYGELRKLAHARLAREKKELSLWTTELVHEAYLRLIGDRDVSWDGRAHFFGAAAEAMRRILIDRARKRNRVKHGAGRKRVPIDVVELAEEEESVDMLALDEALERMKEKDPRMVQVVMLRFFAGLSVEDTARVMETSTRTVKRDWQVARAWLFRDLHGGDFAPAKGTE